MVGWGDPEHLAKLRALGRGFGYPDCCVEAFCQDVAAGRRPAATRGVTFRAPSGNGCYVPCDACARASA